MTAHKFAPGGASQGGRSGPALQPPDLWARSVRRRSRRHPVHVRGVIDWGFVMFTLAVAATVFVLTYVALVRGR
jgi:hypothetical protein